MNTTKVKDVIPKKVLIEDNNGKKIYLSAEDHRRIRSLVGVNGNTEGIQLVAAMVGWLKKLKSTDIITSK
jgi:hypothetical protein